MTCSKVLHALALPFAMACSTMACSTMVLGCASGALIEEREGGPGGGPGGEPGPGSPRWTLDVDTSASDRYLPIDVASATVRGTVRASEGAEHVEVGGRSVSLDASGSFSTSEAVSVGLSHVEVRAFDRAMHEARGDVAVMRSEYIPEGDMNDGAIAIAVSDAILAGLADGALGAVDGIDLSAFIRPGTPLVADGPCTIIADSVSHGSPTITLRATEDGRLQAVASIGDITVGFHGDCNVLGTAITIRSGSQADETTVQLSMILEPIVPAPGECIGGFTSSEVSVAITTFDLDLRLSGCGLLCLFGEVVGEIAEGVVRGMLEDQFGSMVDGLIDPLLADVSVLDVETSLDFLGAPVDVGLCMTSLGPEEGQLVAGLGARASGGAAAPVAADAPGAPFLPPSRTPLAPETMLLDPGLVSQILFAVWRGGALHIEDLAPSDGSAGGLPLNTDSIAILVPQLRAMINAGEVPAGAPLDIALDAGMAPLVRGATPAERELGAELYIEIGDLAITIGAGGRELFEIATTVRLGLTLVPDAAGALVPTLVPEATSSTTFVRRSEVPGVPATVAARLADLVDGLIPTQLDDLLAGAAIAIPDVGVPLTVSEVRVLDGGYLELNLGAPTEAILGEPPRE